MNKKWLPHGITAGALVVFIMLGLACASSPPPKWAGLKYNGEDTPLLEGTTWTFVDHRQYVITKTGTAEFRNGGNLFLSGAWNDSNITWERVGNIVKFITNDGYVSFEGTYNPETDKILGYGEDSSGGKWAWDFTLKK